MGMNLEVWRGIPGQEQTWLWYQIWWNYGGL